MTKSPIDRALSTFPKLYYYVPPLPRKIRIGENTVELRPRLDTTLWLLECLASDNKKGFCLQGQLQDIVQRYHPTMSNTSFSTLTSDLHDEGYITKSLHGGDDDRLKQLSLTKEGEKLLTAIKTLRRDGVISFLFERLTPAEQEALASSLEAVADRTWPKIKEAIRSSNRQNKTIKSNR